MFVVVTQDKARSMSGAINSALAQLCLKGGRRPAIEFQEVVLCFQNNGMAGNH
jgi:hypothetical protein